MNMAKFHSDALITGCIERMRTLNMDETKFTKYVKSVFSEENISKYLVPVPGATVEESSDEDKKKKVSEKKSDEEPKKKKSVKSEPTETIPVSVFDPSKNYTIQQLKDLCKQYKLAVSGTKPVLMERLTALSEVKGEVSKAETKPKEEAKKPLIPSKIMKKVEKSASELLASKEAKVHIKYDKPSGQWIHEETNTVWTKDSKIVVGTLCNENGKYSMKPLTIADIELCKQHNFDYFMPETFEQQDDDDDEEVEEIKNKTAEQLEEEIEIVDDDEEDEDDCDIDE